MSVGISTSTGPPRPLRSREKARRMIAGTSAASITCSVDLVMPAICTVEEKFGLIWAIRRAYPMGSTRTGTLSP